MEFAGPWEQSSLSLAFELDGHPLYRFVEGHSVAFSIRHPTFGAEGAHLPHCSRGNASTSPVSLSDWAEVRGSVQLSGAHSISWEQIAKTILPKGKAPREPQTWYESLNEFAAVHNLLLGQLAKIALEACTFDLVEASRTIPSDSELTFALTKQGELADPASLHFQLGSAERYAPVAQSAAALDLKKKSRRSKPFADDGALAESVNHTLAVHLYTDRGYHLDVDLTGLSREHRSIESRKNLPFWLVNLCLRDSAGRRLSFTDVGSGIGYVLPAIIALWTTRRCFVQQPELHLHPALQTSLGDAFIEASKDRRTLLIETHSEHILLRILKRIRQSSHDAARVGAYRLSPDDLCIVYCESSPDGTTRAVTLRVTSDGDFVGRWPRGFFAERDGELFDE